MEPFVAHIFYGGWLGWEEAVLTKPCYSADMARTAA